MEAGGLGVFSVLEGINEFVCRDCDGDCDACSEQGILIRLQSFSAPASFFSFAREEEV
jgi:hypothetical protein